MAVSHIFSNAAANFTGTITGFNSQASTTTIAATGLVRPQDWNSVHNEFITLTGNTSGNSTVSGTNIQFSGFGGITLQGNNDTLIFNAPFYANLSQIEPYPFDNNSSASSPGQSTMYLQHFQAGENMSICRINRLVSLSVSANFSFPSNSVGSRSNSWGYSESVGLFQRGTGTNSTRLELYFSQSWSMGMSDSINATSGGATTMSISRSANFGFVSQINSTGGVTSGTFSSTNSTQTSTTSISLTNVLSNISGIAQLVAPLATTISAGDWWLAQLGISSTTSAGTATNLLSMSQIVLTGYTSDLKNVGQTATATNIQLVLGNGFWNAQVAALSASIPLSSINANSQISTYFNLAEQTYPGP